MIYLFLILGHVGPSLVADRRAPPCRGDWLLIAMHQASCFRAQAPGVGASVVEVHGLSRLMACGVSLDHRLNPCPLHWQAASQPLGHQGSPEGLVKWSRSCLGKQV